MVPCFHDRWLAAAAAACPFLIVFGLCSLPPGAEVFLNPVLTGPLGLVASILATGLVLFAQANGACVSAAASVAFPLWIAAVGWAFCWLLLVGGGSC